jgi:hypothetical protein
MYNYSRMWKSRPRNMEFRLVFATNRRFSLEPWLTPIDFEQKFEFF